MESPLPQSLHTPRLLLRAPRAADGLALFEAYTQDAQVARYMTWRPQWELQQTEAFVAACIRAWNDGERMPYILCLAGREHEAIGMLEARLMGHMIDIGYVLARRHWGSGLMVEAITALTTAALALPTFFRIQASCDENVVEKNNFNSNSFDVTTNGTLILNKFSNNYWDKYEGYDLNHDGIGDIPYHPVSVYSMITERIPVALIFLRSFMATLMEKTEKAIPSLTPENFRDDSPVMKPFAL